MDGITNIIILLYFVVCRRTIAIDVVMKTAYGTRALFWFGLDCDFEYNHLQAV